MTEQEKAEVIERAARAHTMTLNGQHEDSRDAWSAMRAALEAVGFFELVEAADAFLSMEEPRGHLRAALAKAKGQTNETV